MLSVQSPESWPALVLVVAAGSLLGLTGLFVVQLRRQVQAAWTETGLIFKRSSARFAAVGDLVDGILFETDVSRTLTFTNQAFHSLTGFRERDLRSGLTLIDLFDPEERLRLQEDLETTDDLQAVRVRNCNLQCRDGAVVPVRLRMAAITEQQRLVGWRGLLESRPDTEEVHEPRAVEKILGGILRDFNDTPPAQHEVALERALAEIGRILGADRCYHYHSSGDGENLLSLRQWYAPGVSPMTGDQRLPGLGHYPWSLARLRDDGALMVSDVQYLDNDGAPERSRWLRQGITSLLVVALREGREVVGVLGCETLGRVRHWGQRDRQLLEALAEICQRYQDVGQAARRLEQANERAGDLAELLPEPVAVTDQDDQIVVWNPALVELSHLTSAAACGRGAATVLNDFLPGASDWLRGPSPASKIFEIPGRGEGSVWIRISRRRLADGAGSLLHFCDVTASKAEELRMRARSDRLERAVARQQEKLAQAEAKLLEKEASPRRRPIRLEEHLGELLLSLAPHLRQKHISARCDCPDDLVLVADPDVLTSIVTNLVLYAVEHAFDGMLMGEINLEVAALDGQLRFRFGDNGRGLDRRQQALARNTGLHVVHDLVTVNMGGEITCDGRVGKGTVFEITVPQL